MWPINLIGSALVFAPPNIHSWWCFPDIFHEDAVQYLTFKRIFPNILHEGTFQFLTRYIFSTAISSTSKLLWKLGGKNSWAFWLFLTQLGVHEVGPVELGQSQHFWWCITPKGGSSVKLNLATSFLSVVRLMIASLMMPCPLKILKSFADFPAPTSARVVCVHFDSVIVSNEIDRSTCT